MGAIERLREILVRGKFTRGRKVPVYNDATGAVDHYALELVEVLADDLVEAAEAADKSHPVVSSLHKGASHPAAADLVTIKADDLFELLDRVGQGSVQAPVTTAPAATPAANPVQAPPSATPPASS